METSLYYELLEIMEKQDEVIRNKDKLIAKLINENMEKENMIDTLLKEEEYLYQ